VSTQPILTEITPTAFLSGPESDLRQLLRVKVSNPGASCSAALLIRGGAADADVDLGFLPEGEAVQEVLIPETRLPADLTFVLRAGGAVTSQKTVLWQPPRRWRVHVVQHSHHDVGYTNLSSTVLREHCEFLDEAIGMAEATAGFPDEAQFRLVIEQAWSLQEFLRRAPEERVQRMGELLRTGRVELTALFGNMTTELCGPEELIRALYPSQRIARRFGLRITTAEHNDIPGLSWGLAQVLTEAGIEFFSPGLPRYWNWCDPAMQSFWDDAVLFPHGRPGGFWWEAPSGRHVLLWESAFGAGGNVHPSLPGLAERLQELLGQGYPYESVYWPVRGGARDNSPYIVDYCHTVREWNERWTYPRLIVSTNDRFYRDLREELAAGLPVFRGELPGQDYPVGATSTAAATGVNRATHVQLLVAERLSTIAAATTDLEPATGALDGAYEDALWYDEHTWGHHFPAGPAAEASEHEKQVHAYRAAAVTHDVISRSLARIADHVQLPDDGFHIVVCNPLPHPRTAAVSAPMRELENCGSVMAAGVDAGDAEPGSYLRGVALTDRWHLHPPAALVRGDFDLLDVETGEPVPFQLVELTSPHEPVPYAPQRHGLAQGGKRLGFFEAPSGLNRDLRFVARDLPACGYRTYQLRPWPESPPPRPAHVPSSDLVIENEYYRVQADRDTGRVTSLTDREADRELLDADAPHALGQLVVRDPDGVLPSEAAVRCQRAAYGPVYHSLQFVASAPGHPQVCWTLRLYAGVKRLELACRVLKDPTPLLEAYLAFPFLMESPQYRYESVLAAVEPIRDFLPGAYWDAVAVQNWVRLSDGEGSLLWSSLEAPIVSLGQLQPGYVSPAHSCQVPQRAHHAPATAEVLGRGWLYSLLFANNFGTNFAVSQSGTTLFRYSLTTAPGALSDAEATRLGWEAVTPCATIFAERRRPGHLPLSASLASVSGDYLSLLACKVAEDGRGLILRLWNPAATPARSRVTVGFAPLAEARLTSVTERDDATLPSGARLLDRDEQGFGVEVGPRCLATVRLSPVGEATSG
jgi:hypothetical protein